MRRFFLMVAVAMIVLAATFEVTANQVVIRRGRIEVGKDQFERWMFRTSGNEAGCRKRLQASLTTEVARLTRQFDLTTSQQQKLRLAAEGDIKQFFDRVERARDFFRKNRTGRQAMNAVLQEIQPLQQQLTGDFFDGDSLFRKVLATTLDDSQSEALHALEEQERVDRHHRLVRQRVVQIETKVPMIARQRDAFMKLLIEHSRLPTKRSQYDSQLLTYYASEIPDEALAEIFDKPQREALQRVLQGGQRLKPFLEQKGLLSEDDTNE